MNKSLIDFAWNALMRAIVALPFAVAAWLPFLFGSLHVLRPIIEFITRLMQGQTVSGLSAAGSLEWTLQTNLAFADKPGQLYELSVQPQYFMLPFPLIWAGVWVCAPRGKKARCLLIATVIGLAAVLIPLLLQVTAAVAFAAHAIGLNAVVTQDFAGRMIVRTYTPPPIITVELMGFARTVIVYFNLFVLPPLLSVLCSNMLSRLPSAAKLPAASPKKARHGV